MALSERQMILYFSRGCGRRSQQAVTYHYQSPLRLLYHHQQAVQTKAKRAIRAWSRGKRGRRRPGLTLPWATLAMTKPHSSSSWAASSLSCVSSSSSSSSCYVPPPWSPKCSSKKQRSSRRRAKNGAAKNGAAVAPRRTSSIYKGVTRCVIDQGSIFLFVGDVVEFCACDF